MIKSRNKQIAEAEKKWERNSFEMSCSSWVSLSKWHFSRALKQEEPAMPQWREEKGSNQEEYMERLWGRKELGLIDVHVQIVKEITSSYGKGFAFYPHCNGNLEVFRKIWFTCFEDCSDFYVENAQKSGSRKTNQGKAFSQSNHL